MIIFTARIVNKRYILERYPLEVEIESNRISEIQERREAVYVFFFLNTLALGRFYEAAVFRINTISRPAPAPSSFTTLRERD